MASFVEKSECARHILSNVVLVTAIAKRSCQTTHCPCIAMIGSHLVSGNSACTADDIGLTSSTENSNTWTAKADFDFEIRSQFALRLEVSMICRSLGVCNYALSVLGNGTARSRGNRACD